MNIKPGTQRSTSHRTHNTAREVVPTFGNGACRDGSSLHSCRMGRGRAVKTSNLGVSAPEPGATTRKFLLPQLFPLPLQRRLLHLLPQEGSERRQTLDSTLSSSSAFFSFSSSSLLLASSAEAVRKRRVEESTTSPAAPASSGTSSDGCPPMRLGILRASQPPCTARRLCP